MLDRLFLRRLEDEVPRWVARGWLTSESGHLILADMAERAGAVRSPGLAFAVVGVILLGSGVVTFFAANWPDLPRLFKLALVFGTLWGAHAGALALERRHYPRLAEAVALLTVLLFGAAIMLVAQMYHMGADPPAGVLLWTFGAIATAWVWRSGLCTLAAYALAVLWLNVVDGGWSYGHHPIPWGFLGLWAALLPLVLRHRWRLPSHAAILSLLWWCAWALAEAADRYDGSILEVTRVAAAGAVLALAVAGSFHLP
ncbi:MAG: DUF2157 domain-containing protein, partial [Rhodospirillales bacterium]|nr:DUF2157 domain-containing protein [Rhodospirillales bacterium]